MATLHLSKLPEVVRKMAIAKASMMLTSKLATQDVKADEETVNALADAAMIRVGERLPPMIMRALAGGSPASKALQDETWRSNKNSSNFSYRIETGMFLSSEFFGSSAFEDPDPALSFESMIESVANTTMEISDARRKGILDTLKEANAEYSKIILKRTNKVVREAGQHVLRENYNQIQQITPETHKKLATFTQTYDMAKGGKNSGVRMEQLQADSIVSSLEVLYEKMNTLLMLSLDYRNSKTGAGGELVLLAAELFNNLQFEPVIRELFKNNFLKIKMVSFADTHINTNNPYISYTYSLSFDFSAAQLTLNSVVEYLLAGGLYQEHSTLYPGAMENRRQFFWDVSEYMHYHHLRGRHY